MTELEPREDDWARGVFDRVRTGQHEPPWIPDAAAAAERSARHRRRRTGVAGALSAAAVIGLSTTAYATFGGGSSQDGQQIAPPGVTSPTSRASSATTAPSTAPTTPTTAPTTATHPTESEKPPQSPTTPTSATPPTVDDTALGQYFQFTGGYVPGPHGSRNPLSGDMPWSAAGLSTIGTVAEGMDPNLAHLRGFPMHSPQITVGLPAGAQQSEIDASSYWAPNGDLSALDSGGSHPTAPYGYITVSTTSPSAVNDGKPAGPCGIPDHAFARSLSGIPTAWSPCEKHPLADGSVVISAHALNVASGTVTLAAREFPGGAIVLVTASSFVVYNTPPGGGMGLFGYWTAQPPDYTAGPGLPSVPWTDDSLVAALSAPGVKALP